MAWWQPDESADIFRENNTVPIVPLPVWRVASVAREMVMLNKTSTTPLVPLRACLTHRKQRWQKRKHWQIYTEETRIKKKYQNFSITTTTTKQNKGTTGRDRRKLGRQTKQEVDLTKWNKQTQAAKLTLAAEQARFGTLSRAVARRDREPRKHITAHRRRQKLSRQRSKPMTVE